MVTRVCGLPAWLLWCGFLVIGAELAFLPYYPVLGWQKTESKAIDDGYTRGNGWNSLRVAITGDRADLFVNGARVGSAPYEVPLGGGMAGFHADFLVLA
jgi:hypothetical protein